MCCGAMYLPPRGLDQVLLAVGDPHPALVVDLADVAGREPAVAGQHLGRLLGQVVVAAHDAAAAHQDLAVVGDPDLGAGERLARRCRTRLAGTVERGGRAGLGEPVALEDQQPGGVEPPRDVGRQRRAARDEVAGAGRRCASLILQNTSLSATGYCALSSDARLAALRRAPSDDLAADVERPAEDLQLGAALLLGDARRPGRSTFSKMRGTPAMNVGRTAPRFSTILSTRPSTAVAKPTWHWTASSTLPNECASGSHRYCTSSGAGSRARRRQRPRTPSSRGSARRPWAGRWCPRCRSASPGARGRRPRRLVDRRRVLGQVLAPSRSRSRHVITQSPSASPSMTMTFSTAAISLRWRGAWRPASRPRR